MKYTFAPDKIVIMMSVLCIIGTYVMISYTVNAIYMHKWYSAIPTILGIGLICYFIMKVPYCIYVEKESIIVKQLIGCVRIADIKNIERLSSKEFSKSIRQFGNGGFLGYVGSFYSKNIGNFYMAAINKNELVKITTNSGKKYVINYPCYLLE